MELWEQTHRLCTWSCACTCGACKPAWGCCRDECLSSAGLLSELPATGWPADLFASHSTISLQTQGNISRPTDARQRPVGKKPSRGKVRTPMAEVRQSLLRAIPVTPGASRDGGAEACTAPHCNNVTCCIYCIAVGTKHTRIDQCWFLHFITVVELMHKVHLAPQSLCA